MNPFSRLFRKAPSPPAPPPTLSERHAALQSATPEVLVDAALAGDDTHLRVSAVRLLPDGDALRGLAGVAEASQAVKPTPSVVRQAAHARLAELIDAGLVDIAALCRGRDDLAPVLTVAALCKDPDRVHQLLVRIEDPAVLARLAVTGPTSRVRQSAAAAIVDPVQLHELLPRVRGKDKAVYRIIKQKCDALIAGQRRQEELAREASALCASLESHSTRMHDARYLATLETLSERWRALPLHADPQVELRGNQALARCREVVAVQDREQSLRAAAQAAEQAAREERERVRQVEQQVEQQAAQLAAAERAEAEARSQAEKTAVREADDHARAERQAAATQALREIGGLIRLARVALQVGNTRKSARLRQAIEDAMQVAPTLPADLARSLQLLDEKLNELRQWKDYVVAPKRIELIEEMEALVGAQEEPQALAEQVRALQQEWRTINKGIASDASAESERFQQAFQAAFKPCQEYFQAQAAVRRENLEARKRVLERLQAFISSQEPEQADYDLVAQVLREAPREWRSHSPVDREGSRPTETAFHQAMERLWQFQHAWHERNEAEKRSLITQAQHLSSTEDTTQAIEDVKRLQALWKATAPASRDRAQALWEEFRAVCDAVYQRREQAYALYSSGLETARRQALALCEQVEQAGSVPAAERLEAHTKVREWHAAFDELGEMPRADARGLRERFERAISRYEAGLAQQDQRDTQAAESNLFEAARHLRAYERALVQDLPDEECRALRDAAVAFMADVRRWPKGGLQALQQALARAGSASAADVPARERALRMLCIRCEILSSMPTPSEDEDLRRDLEMRLLVAGLGQASHTDDRDWDAMLLEWIGIGAVAPEVHEALQQRFMRCLAGRTARSARANPFEGYVERRDRADRDPGERKTRRDGRGRPETTARR